MTRRKVLTVLDSLMFLSFLVLMSWRFSGLIAHEWIGFAMIALVFGHLLVHWGWVEETVGKAVNHSRRGRVVPLLLNTSLFLAMGTALVSGVVISKVVLPNHLLPGDYVQWHGLHETSATLALVIVGLHVALNWDRVRAGIRRLFTKSRRPAGVASGWRVQPDVALRTTVSVLLVCGVLIGALWAKTHIFPSNAQVLMMFPDGHTELTSPPADIAQIHPGSTVPDPTRGGARFILCLVVVIIAAVIGRRVLKLRLSAADSDESSPKLRVPPWSDQESPADHRRESASRLR